MATNPSATPGEKQWQETLFGDPAFVAAWNAGDKMGAVKRAQELGLPFDTYAISVVPGGFMVREKDRPWSPADTAAAGGPGGPGGGVPTTGHNPQPQGPVPPYLVNDPMADPNRPPDFTDGVVGNMPTEGYNPGGSSAPQFQIDWNAWNRNGPMVGSNMPTSGQSGTTGGNTPLTPKKSGFDAWEFIKDNFGTIVGAGTAIYGANRQAGAYEEAAEIQAKTAAEALAYEKEIFERQQKDLAPWRNVGGYSMGQLGHLVGMPEGFTNDAAPAAADSTAAPSPAATADVVPTARTPLTPRPSVLPSRTGGHLVDQRLRNLAASDQTASSFVKLQSPDGEVRDVPASQAQLYINRGARRIE